MTHKKTIILAISTIFVLAIVASLIFVIKHNSFDIKTKMIPIKEIIKARLWIVIALVSTVVLSFSSILIYYSIEKNKKLPVKSSMIGILIGSSILTGFLIGGIYRAITYKSDVIIDQVSQDRMDRINEVFNSQFGPKWIIVFAVFICFLIIILYQLYRNNSKGVDVNLNDQNATLVTKYLLWGAITVTIGVLILTTIAIKKMIEAKQALKTKEGDLYTTSQISDLTKIVGLGVVTLIVVVIVILLIIKQIKR